MRKSVLLLTILSLLSHTAPLSASHGFASPRSAMGGAVELHSHLFMDRGMGPFFKGTFNGPLMARSWKTRFRSQANPESLDRSGVQIMVATLYALPRLGVSRRDAIRAQILTAKNFVETHPRWALAGDPSEARAALAAGKRALILSLEGADGILECEADLREFIDEGGIRIVTPLHLTDDQYGGAAFLRDYHAWSNPFPLIGRIFHGRAEDGIFHNPRGLSARGRALIQALALRRTWIDLTHASDRSQSEIVPMLKEAGQPLLYTHTVLRKYYEAERAISDGQLALVKASGGIIGLVPSEEMLDGTESSFRFCPESCSFDDCHGGIFALAQQYSEAVERLGAADRVMMGSDFNGGLPHLPPACGTGTSLDRKGLREIGQVSEMWDALARIGAPVPKSFDGMAEAFLSAWERVRFSRR